MKYTEALQVVIEAAGICRDQWQQCASEDSPNNCIEELWEAGHDEAQEMADTLTGALKIVRPDEVALRTEHGRIGSTIEQLAEIDRTLAEIVRDYQDASEEVGNTVLGFGDICAPEDANPDVDGVRVQIDKAMTQLQKYRDTLPPF